MTVEGIQYMSVVAGTSFALISIGCLIALSARRDTGTKCPSCGRSGMFPQRGDDGRDTGGRWHCRTCGR